MPRPPRDPFDVTLKPEQKTYLGLWLHDELRKGLDAKAANDDQVDYWHQLYEQAPVRTGTDAPWPDAADLTSHIGTEKTDALHARLVRAVAGGEPIWSVEGWGESAQRAPYVEEFTQWKAEESRIQTTIDRLALISLIEPRGLLEIYEGTEMRTTRRDMKVAPQRTPEGALMLGADGAAIPMKNGDTYQEATGDELALDMVVDTRELVRTGPVERIIPYKDSVILPGHAREKSEIWAYGKRLWPRWGVLQRQANRGIYDKEAMRLVTPDSEKEPTPQLQRANMDVTYADDSTAPIELWEMLVLVDLPLLLETAVQGLPKLKKKELQGERWYVMTLHPRTQTLLRIQHDDMDRSRFVPVILFPRPDRCTEGFSLIGHKLITTIEEHTAWRNMIADRGSLAINAPIKRLQGALWDPDADPLGPKSVIDVKDMREVEQMVIADVPQSAYQREQAMEQTGERLIGINDIASGQVSSESRTLGEVRMATEQSFVRMDLVVRRFQEALEDVGAIRHAIWQRTLAERPEGMPAPQSLIANLEGAGVSIDDHLPDRKVTAALLDGAFRFKPHGSVETADPNLRRSDLLTLAQMLPMLVASFPQLGPMFQTPQAARAIMREVLRTFRVENEQAFIGSPESDLQTQQMEAAMMALQNMPGMGAMPGGPGGLPQPPGPVPPGGAPVPGIPGAPAAAAPPVSPSSGQPSGVPLSPGNPLAPPA